jgi:hypothetical protein
MTTALVSVETVLLVVLIVLVAGLLRSHAELLRRLGPADDGSAVDGIGVGSGAGAAGSAAGSGAAGSGSAAGLAQPPAAPARTPGEAPALAGSTPAGDAVQLAFHGAQAPTLLAFLTSGCGTCAGFWETLGEQRLPPGVRTVIVTRGPEREQPAKLRLLAPPGVPVVMSSQAWEQYRIPGAPYFVLVDEEVRGEGVATTWHALSSLVSDAIADQRAARSIDQTFAAAGIGPDHPSLFPGGRS